MQETCTRRETARLLRCSPTLPSRYLASKAEHDSQKVVAQQKLNFRDLMELRVWTHLSHCDDRSWNAIRKIARERAQALDTPYPFSDRRNLTGMLTMRRVHSIIGPRRNPISRETEFHEGLSRLLDALEFDGNTTVRWRAGTDMDLALPDADVVINHAERDGNPTVAGTGITTREVMLSAQRNGGRTRQSHISLQGVEVALAYELALRLSVFQATTPQDNGASPSPATRRTRCPGSRRSWPSSPHTPTRRKGSTTTPSTTRATKGWATTCATLKASSSPARTTHIPGPGLLRPRGRHEYLQAPGPRRRGRPSSVRNREKGPTATPRPPHQGRAQDCNQETITGRM